MTLSFASQFEYLSRYALAALSLVILLGCVFSLFRSRPRREVMATLQNLANGDEIEITTWETSIGRSRSCDVVLAYGTVSRSHAVLSLRKEGWFIFDTDSKTGVFVNGEQIEKKARIYDGDTLSFGTASLQFHSNGYGAEGENQGTGEIPDFTNAARLVNLADNSAYYLTNGYCLLGRSRESDIWLKSADISEAHATLTLTRDGWMLSDLGSENGTYLNDDLLFADMLLYDGDIIDLGGYRFMFRE